MKYLIEKFETELGQKAIKNFLLPRAEEIETTFADTTQLGKTINYKRSTTFGEGIKKFI